VSCGRNIDNTIIVLANYSELENIESIKDLGVTFDSRLKFSLHLNEKINKAYSILGIIKRNFTYLDKDSFL